MRKLHAKIGTVLTVLLCMVLVLGVVGIAGAADNSYVLKSDDSGYVANSTAITLGPGTVVSMQFGIDFIREEDGVKTGLGDGEVGFGIVDAKGVNNALLDFENDEYGFAICYDKTTNFIGGAVDGVSPKNKSLGMAKEEVFQEGKSYRVVFDNTNDIEDGTSDPEDIYADMYIEAEASGTGTWYLIQHVTGIKPFKSGTKVFLGMFYRDGVNMVLADVTYESYQSTDGALSLPLAMTEGINYVNGTKVTTLDTKGEAFIANKEPIDNEAEIDYVVSFSVSDVTASDDTTITFALTSGTAPANGKIKTGQEGLSFMLHAGTGVISDVNGALEDHEAFVNVSSILSAGNKVKAVFNPSSGRFSLLINSGDKFVEWFSMEELDIPTQDVYFGVEISGSVSATFYGFELYFPSDPDLIGQNITRFDRDQGILGNDYGAELTYDSEGVIIETVKKTGFDPTGNVYSSNELSVERGQMIAIVLDELIEYVPGVNRLQDFGFGFVKVKSDNWDNRQVFYGSGNVHFTMSYDTHGRYVYTICTDPETTQVSESGAVGKPYFGCKTLGDGFTFADIISEKEYGTSYMACYDPYELVYYLYKKTETEPDYTLISTVNLVNQTFTNDTLGWTVNPYKQDMIDAFRASDDDKTFHAAITITGGMTLKMKDLKAFVIDSDKLGVNDVKTLMTKEDNESSATLVAKGKNLYASQDGYIYTQESVKIEDGQGLAMEYDIENVSYLAGTYNIGWIITNNLEVITSNEEKGETTLIDNNITVQNSKPKDPIKYSLLQFTGSSDLTPSFADNMRDTLMNTGISFRVIFYNDGTIRLQTKIATSYVWNDIEYGEPETGYEEGNDKKQHPNNSLWKYAGEDVYVGIRLQATYNLDVTDEVKIYMIEEDTPYKGNVSVVGGSLEIKPGTLRFADIQVASSDSTRGTVTMTGNENIEDSEIDIHSTSVYMDSDVTLIATAKPGYAFEGWYLDGKKVSSDSTAIVTVAGDSEYEANFVKATKVSVTNGTARYEAFAEDYFKNDDYMRLLPVTSVGYDFSGWNIKLVEIDLKTGNVITKESYDITTEMEDTSTNNMLAGTNVEYNVWGTLKNAIVGTDTCIVTQEPFYNVITFGSFSVIDRAGYENGDLIVMIPGLTCDYEYNVETAQDEMVVERKVIVEALYTKGDRVTSIRDKVSYPKQHLENMELITTVGICFLVLFVIGLAVLIVLKKYVSYKKDIKALLEYEFVLKENDKL